jgi:hypothetical protein
VAVSVAATPAFIVEQTYKIKKKWANMKRALPDLIPQLDLLEKAVYSYPDLSIC